MSRSFFKDILASSVTKKKPAAQAPVDDPVQSIAQDTPSAPVDEPEIYDDVSVCRVLRIHRRVLDGARTQQSRGEHWDVIGLHAGMTRKWIYDYAVSHGIVPAFFDGALNRIKKGDGVVSVRLVGTHPNPCRCTVEIIATGEREFCSVRNLYQFPIHYREAFDAKRVEMNLEWMAYLNACKY